MTGKFLENEVEPSLHELVRQNVLTATRNYDHRVKKFIKEIITGSGSPMNVIKYSTKVEFQGRGAAHNHGTLWVDLNKIEFTFEAIDGSIDLEQIYATRNEKTQKERLSFEKSLRKLIENGPHQFEEAEELAIKNFYNQQFPEGKSITTEDILK